ncbi:MAG: lipoyl(octanoyl) transferase LipB [Bacteroidia bacterium]|nr:lipoyl(octanoyl) transferase LipB [Bacteroidia bacterium]
MAYNLIFTDLGMTGYMEAWDYQEKIFRSVVDAKMTSHSKPENEKEITKGQLIFCEHPHVYTLGKSGSEDNLLLSSAQMKDKNISFVRTNRGGDITYHGPGQIVGYPVFDLSVLQIGLKDYIHLLEESVILTLKHYNIEAARLEGATGVWLDTEKKIRVRKICAIGVRSSHWVTMHGFAFNVNTDLSWFNFINPCGFTDKGVTSLEKELGKKQDMNEVKSILKSNIAEVFDLSYEL